MAKDPAFLFYPNDYIGGTMGMTFEEKGAYMELLMLQFNRGHMTKHMIGQTIGQLWGQIEDKFEVDEEGKYFNRRLDEEKEKRKKYTESRRNNKKGKNQHSKKEGHMTSHMENENEIVNKDNNKGVEFEKFWDLYDKKRGSKKKIEKKWYSLPNETRQNIIDYLPAYVSSTPNKTFRKDPQTFLNNESWEDEILLTSSAGGKGLYTYQEIIQIHGDQRDPRKQQDFEPTDHKGENGKPLWKRKAS